MSELDELKRHIRTIPDWPKAGVMFRDITPLLQDPRLLRAMTKIFVERYAEAGVTLVAGIDARGFIVGPLIAHQLGVGFVPVRKQGKLPFETVSAEYALEYGTATVELHIDACQAGDRVLLVDDLIATGGTMLAAVKLLRALGAEVVEGAAIVDLSDLGGSARLRDAGVSTFVLARFSETEQ
ncbi:MAG: adenine phosphoribosyltransferase [Lautropia sp.]|nr:adenine phosphoribosyltransferase [Lautropia sp.]